MACGTNGCSNCSCNTAPKQLDPNQVKAHLKALRDLLTELVTKGGTDGSIDIQPSLAEFAEALKDHPDGDRLLGIYASALLALFEKSDTFKLLDEDTTTTG